MRISRSSMLMNDLVSSSKQLVMRMKNQGGNENRMNRVLRKVVMRHANVFSSYEADADELIRAIVE